MVAPALLARVVSVQRRAVLRPGAGQPDPVQVQQLVVVDEHLRNRPKARDGIESREGRESQTAPLQRTPSRKLRAMRQFFINVVQWIFFETLPLP